MNTILLLLTIAIPVACIAWTVTHEEIFKEFHDYATRKSERSRSILVRKFFYMLSCEYCFSHYVAALVVLVTGYTLILSDWRGVVLGIFAIVWVANIYMSLYAKVRTNLKKERLTTEIIEESM